MKVERGETVKRGPEKEKMGREDRGRVRGRKWGQKEELERGPKKKGLQAKKKNKEVSF